MHNLLILDSDPDFLNKASRALVSTGHRFLARCKDAEGALGLIESRKHSNEPVKVLLANVPVNDPQVTNFLRKLSTNFPEVAALIVQQDEAWRTAIDIFSSKKSNPRGNMRSPLDARGLVTIINEAIDQFADQKSRGLAVEQLWKKLQPHANSPDFIERFLDEVLTIMEVTSGSIFFFDEKRERLVLAAAKAPDGMDLVGLTKNVGEGVAGYVAHHKKPLLVVSRDAAPVPVKPPGTRYETESFICAPLLNEGRLIGVLNLTEKKSKKPFTGADLDFLMEMVEQFSANIEQAFQHRNLRDKNRKLSAAIKKTSAKLRDSQAQLSFIETFNTTVVDNIPLGVVVLDEHLHIRSANESFRELFTERGKEIVGHALSGALSSVSVDGHQLWEERVREAFREEKTSISHFTCPMAEGTKSVFNINARSFRSSEDPEKRLLLLIIEDITNELMLETRIARAQRLAEMGELVAGVAHEINNPLDGIIRYANLGMQKSNGDEFIRECFCETKNGLQRISRIVKSLMQYTRNCSKTFVATNVNELLDNILVLMSWMQTKRNIRLEKVYERKLPHILARSNLDQVFINLIKNAFEAMEPGGTLEIKTSLEDENVLIQFKDTGCGIPKEVLSKLGESFVTTKDNGTGLGLSICQEIVEQHNGELIVRSEVGVGSTMIVRLPIEQQEKGDEIG
jgi:PAS domain S-box-containing protein